ncbi:hypothetical protein FM103_16000 [Corynebacterium xerosis]|nr:hypothetical protein FM103_16000 [Corynebacterium xerosis]
MPGWEACDESGPSTVDLDATLVTAICRKHEQMKSLLLLR